MIFRQLFDRDTSTYTYLLADSDTREAVLIDPVREQVERDVKLLEALNLRLVWVLETHAHADHVTAAGLLRARLGAKTVASAASGVTCADVRVVDRSRVQFGRHAVEVRTTPGHTDGCVSYIVSDHQDVLAFTGDALLIGGCGRTDFQQGNSELLCDSVHNKLFTLPDHAKVYPGHDYRGHTMSTIGDEKRLNPRLGGGIGRQQFVNIMNALNLPLPKRIDTAVPANLACGQDPGPRDLGPEDPALADDAVQIVDVREPGEFVEGYGHIPGAINIPMRSLGNSLSRLARMKRTVVVCRSGRRAERACRTLRDAGFTQVHNLAGGMQAYAARGLPTCLETHSDDDACPRPTDNLVALHEVGA